MRKSMFTALVTILLSGLIAATASAQMLVCWELQHELLGIQPIVYKVSGLDMGNGNYSLVGSSLTTTITNPPTTVRRVITGGAVVMEANKIEVSLSTTDISDLPATTVAESLAVSDVHMVLDATLNGTFHIVNVAYPVSSDTESSIVTTSHEGNVSLVDCN
jgi:hypothetical protein